MSEPKRGGRPRSEDPAKHRIVVKVTAGQRLDLRRVASDNRTSLTGVIREAVNEYVADYRERGVFGAPKTRRD